MASSRPVVPWSGLELSTEDGFRAIIEGEVKGEVEGRSGGDFRDDALARKVVQCLLLFQGGTPLAGLSFTFARLNSLTLYLVFVRLVLFQGELWQARIRLQATPGEHDQQAGGTGAGFVCKWEYHCDDYNGRLSRQS